MIKITQVDYWLPRSAADEGVSSSTALVIDRIVGTGVFTLQAVLAGAGTSSLVTLAVIEVRAMLLAVLFGLPPSRRRAPTGTAPPIHLQSGRVVRHDAGVAYRGRRGWTCGGAAC